MKFGESFRWARPVSADSVDLDHTGSIEWQVFAHGTGEQHDRVWETYSPMEYRAAFQRFAAVKTPEDAVEFLVRYGPLDWSPAGRSDQELYAKIGEHDSYTVGLADEWIRQANEMRGAVLLHRALSGKDVKALAAMRKKMPKNGSGELALTDWATAMLKKIANTRLKEHTGLVVVGRLDALDLDVEPTSLLGALWLQFLQVLLGDVLVRKCASPSCPEWLVLKPGSRQRTCAGKCRKALSRAKNPKVEGGESNG